DLGTRPGWPTIQQLCVEAPDVPEHGGTITVTDTGFREKILNRLREANQLAKSEPELASLPFPQIARWSPSKRDWLNQPLDPIHDGGWLLALPKVDLHCHLGGFATHRPALTEVREAAAEPERLPSLSPPEPPENWPLPDQPISLEAYRRLGDANGSALLKDPGCLRAQIRLLYRHLREQNVFYAEVRCSPANYATDERSSWDVLSDIRSAFEECRKEAAAHDGRAPLVNLIVIATRQSGGDFRAGISRHL